MARTVSGKAAPASPATPQFVPAPSKPMGGQFIKTGVVTDAFRNAVNATGEYNGVQDYLEKNPEVKDLRGTGKANDANKSLIGNSLYKSTGSGTDGSQPTTPTTDPNAPLPVDQQIVKSGVDLTNIGSGILKSPNEQANTLMNQGNQTYGQGFSDIGATYGLANSARGYGDLIQDLINSNQQAAQQDVSNYYNAQPLDTLRSNISNLNANLANTGGYSSRSGNNMRANLERGLIRDQAEANLAVNERARAAQEAELANQRSTDTGLAGLFSGQGQNLLNTSANQLQASGNLQDQRTSLGSNIYNQGFQNIMQALGFNNDIVTQAFDRENALRTQNLANIQGDKNNQFSKGIQRRQMDLAEKAQAQKLWTDILAAASGTASKAAGA
jgi:hypothetical protein